METHPGAAGSSVQITEHPIFKCILLMIKKWVPNNSAPLGPLGPLFLMGLQMCTFQTIPSAILYSPGGWSFLLGWPHRSLPSWLRLWDRAASFSKMLDAEQPNSQTATALACASVRVLRRSGEPNRVFLFARLAACLGLSTFGVTDCLFWK